MDRVESVRLPFEHFVRKVVAEAEPLSQNTSEDDLGFGWIYYGLVRNLGPRFVVAIGSRRGFMPMCVARALQDARRGHLFFIDPSYEGDGPPGWSGGALWSDPAEVEDRIAAFGLSGWITHLRMTSADAFPQVRQLIADEPLGLVIVDGSHTFEDSLQDFELYAPLIRDGYVLFHDSTSENCDVPRTIAALRERGLPMITVHREVGLTIVEVVRPPRVADTWGYLCRPSNRGELLVREARTIVRPDDRVLDVYCGASPLAGLLENVELFGCDRDPAIIETLRTRVPQHSWKAIDERNLPFAQLPDAVDVLLGLGVSRGRVEWDAQHVVDNVRYLVGRYLPRACLFETAADYDDAAILDEIRAVLLPHGYACREAMLETDMEDYARRKVLVAERPVATRS
jgi:Methyltransferase domain